MATPNGMQRNVTTGDMMLSGDWLVARLRRLGRESIYAIGGFPLALFSFVLIITLFSVSLGLIVIFAGLPLLAATMMAARGLASVERNAAWLALDREPSTVQYRSAREDASGMRRLLSPLLDGQSWLDALHAVFVFPVAVTVFAVTVAWWATALGGVTWPLWGWALNTGGEDVPFLQGVARWYPIRAMFYMTIGVTALVTLPWAMTGLAWLRAALPELLLIAPSRLRTRVDDLEAGRDAARAAEESSMRRLERDIHDGPQQRLVRMSMDLGRARMKVGEADPELEAALGDVQRQTTETLEELRALSRGIAPPILADRGLDAALRELAARSTIPTTVVVDLMAFDDERPASHVENTAYFVASEALTNAMKHSRASNARIWVDTHDARYGKMLRVQVTDDGVGGADISKGHGLAGLSQRLQGVDGRLDVDSGDGGPTTITAEIPCG